ncbi:hypothetical protein ARMSODRAFT_1071241 [Armillaria solidipes]|uniref:Uncharacterized protein n=1 Tax=Armillaria solidipes TaxID=1076256 RepID=A0A2H3B0Z3_9AGAR|nr:hypothetical protein ARMSODRAFT_1071241 [Armillaria solidipes]
MLENDVGCVASAYAPWGLFLITQPSADANGCDSASGEEHKVEYTNNLSKLKLQKAISGSGNGRYFFPIFRIHPRESVGIIPITIFEPPRRSREVPIFTYDLRAATFPLAIYARLVLISGLKTHRVADPLHLFEYLEFARSQQVSSPSQHSAYRSYLEASDEEILEELARRCRRREGEAPGACGSLSPSTAQPAATPSHAGSQVYASPYCIASISPSRTAPGLSPALSTSPEARTSPSPPTAHRAAAPSHHGSWASAPLLREGIYSPLPSLPSLAPARMPSTLQAAPSPFEGVVRLSPPPLASSPHVEPISLDHGEVVSTSWRSRRVSQDIPLDTSYVPSPKTSRSTFIVVDIPRDYSSSTPNRKVSHSSIHCDENTTPGIYSYGGAIATLSLPQQPGESDVAFSRCRDAHACLTLGGPPVQDAVPSPITKYRSPVKQPQSAFTKHELESSVCEPKRLSPRGSMEAKLQSIKTSAPIQVEEATPLKKSESPALPRGEPSRQQAFTAQDIKNHRLENSSRDQMKAKSLQSRTSLGLDSNVQKTSLQSIPRPHKFHGDPDIIEFDNWLFSVIRWMKIANICGPIYHTDSSDSDAHTWYNNSVEDCNGNVEDDFPTFMQLLISLSTRIRHEITREGVTAEASTVDQIMQQALIIEQGLKAELYYSPQHSRYNQSLEKQHGTLETWSEYSNGTQDTASDHESGCSTGRFHPSDLLEAPIEWDLIPILEACRRHFLNYPNNREAASKSNRGHQHPDRVDYRPETSLPVTGDADVPMAEDGNASNAGSSIPHSSIAPTASPSTKAYSAMTIPSGGSTPNIDGEADELDSQDSDNLSILLLIPYAQSQGGGCKGCGSLRSYYCIISLAIFTYDLRAATFPLAIYARLVLISGLKTHRVADPLHDVMKASDTHQIQILTPVTGR